MRVEDIWSGDHAGHVPGAWDCPCGPWVLTDMDLEEAGLRTVRHVSFGQENSHE